MIVRIKPEHLSELIGIRMADGLGVLMAIPSLVTGSLCSLKRNLTTKEMVNIVTRVHDRILR
jgi:hypothetical protein